MKLFNKKKKKVVKKALAKISKNVPKQEKNVVYKCPINLKDFSNRVLEGQILAQTKKMKDGLVNGDYLGALKEEQKRRGI